MIGEQQQANHYGKPAFLRLVRADSRSARNRVWLGPGHSAASRGTDHRFSFCRCAFDKWAAQGPREEVPWKVHMSADRLSFHQRLIATIQVEVPGPELLKRSHDEHITLLIEVRNGQGVSSRTYGLLNLDNLKPEMNRSDVEFSWQAFAVPGQYEVSV